MFLYVYDIKHKNRRDFNKTKRMFYYNLNKLNLEPTTRITKSTIIVSDGQERIMDLFFKNFKQKTKNIVVFKTFVHSLEEL